MTSKPIHADERFTFIGALPRHGLLRVAGRDASDFLQRQTINDLRQLGQGADSQWSGLLSPKGRLLYLFRLYRCADDEFVLVGAETDAQALGAALKRVVFRSKVSIEALESRLQGAIAAAPPDTAQEWHAWDAGRWVCWTGSTLPDCIEDAWQSIDIERLIPRIGAGMQDRFTPQMLGLGRLNGFSLSKGCYPGQEIVARTHFLGQQKRELQAVLAERDVQVGEAILVDGREAAHCLLVSRLRPRCALAVLPTPLSASLTLADGLALKVNPASVG